MKAVSVVIPAHNAAATIADTLASLRSEAEVIGEVLLVDDSSSDGTAAVAQACSVATVLAVARASVPIAGTQAAPAIWRWRRRDTPGYT